MILSKKTYMQRNMIGGFFYFLSFAHQQITHFFSAHYKKALRRELSKTVIRPILTFDEFEKVRCNSCLLCRDVCPTQCISMEPSDFQSGKDEQLPPKQFNLALEKCIFCNLCVSACPVDALRFDAVPADGASDKLDLSQLKLGDMLPNSWELDSGDYLSKVELKSPR